MKNLITLIKSKSKKKTLRELQQELIPKYISQPKPKGLPKEAIGLHRSIEDWSSQKFY